MSKLRELSQPKKVTHFTTALFDPSYAEYNSNTNELIRGGLLFVEGNHKDNKQRVFEFSAERLENIVNNTNSLLTQGKQIPVLFDHTKTVLGTKGHIKGELYTRPITEEDVELLDNCPAVEKMVGKVGIFCDAVCLKASDAITSFQNNIVRTVSPGFDLAKDTIRELSLVPLPAVDGLSLYSEFNDNVSMDSLNDPMNKVPLTLADALEQDNKLEDVKEDFTQLTSLFWEILNNIYTAQDHQLNQKNPALLIYSAIDEYAQYIAKVLDLPDIDELTNSKTNKTTNRVKGSEQPDFLKNQQESTGKYIVSKDQKAGTSNYNSNIKDYLSEYNTSSDVIRYLKRVS